MWFQALKQIERDRTCAQVALLDDDEVFRLPTLVVLRELLLEDGMELVNVGLVGSVQVPGLEDDDENGQPEQIRCNCFYR